MAVETTKSTILSNIESDPSVIADVRHHHGRIRVKSATLAVAAADDDTSQYRFFRVKAHDSIKSLQLYCDTITGATDYDVGIYDINSGDAVDADCYADAYNLEVETPAVPHVLATAPYLECRFGDATTANINLINQRVWEDASVDPDPGNIEYDVVVTANTVGSGAGDITMIMYYTAGD